MTIMTFNKDVFFVPAFSEKQYVETGIEKLAIRKFGKKGEFFSTYHSLVGWKVKGMRKFEFLPAPTMIKLGVTWKQIFKLSRSKVFPNRESFDNWKAECLKPLPDLPALDIELPILDLILQNVEEIAEKMFGPKGYWFYFQKSPDNPKNIEWSSMLTESTKLNPANFEEGEWVFIVWCNDDLDNVPVGEEINAYAEMIGEWTMEDIQQRISFPAGQEEK